MQVKMLKVGRLRTNCYFLIDQDRCLIIDPGDDFVKIQRMIGSLHVIAILLTHRHEDHTGALADLVRYYGCPVYDRNTLEERKYDFGGIHLQVIYTPGHTSDSISYYVYEYGFMFVGDFIFRGTIGRTDLPTGSEEEMQASLQKISTYSERIILYPGHEAQTTLGEELRNNPFMQKYA